MSTVERIARDRWNAQADEHNQWDMLGGDEQVELMDAEYAAVVAERDALREALTGMVAQHGCDCGHPHCNRCAETRECKAALAQGEVGNG
jgi:hypothetical protein